MPTLRMNVVALATGGILLPIILIPFYTLAAPIIAQEFTRSPTASTPDAPTGAMTGKVKFDIFFALALFLLIIGSFTWLSGCLSFTPPDALVNNPRIRGTYRAFKDMLPFPRFDTLVQWLADAIIGSQTTTSAMDGGGTLPSIQIRPPDSPAPNSDTRPGGVTATPDPATSPSDHHDIAHPPPV